MSQQNGFLDAGDLLKESRREMEIGDGRKIQIRRVGPGVLALALGNIPDLASLTSRSSERASENPAQAKTAMQAIEKLLIAGIVQPKLCADPADGPTPSDLLWADQLLIFNAILEHSGYSKGAAEKVVPFSKIPE